MVISIHAAREGGDAMNQYPHIKNGISIHAAREGGDNSTSCYIKVNYNFNPRRP